MVVVPLSDEPGEAHHAEDNLKDNQRGCCRDEDFPAFGLTRVGEDTADESEQKGQCPEPRRSGDPPGDKQNKHDEATAAPAATMIPAIEGIVKNRHRGSKEMVRKPAPDRKM